MEGNRTVLLRSGRIHGIAALGNRLEQRLDTGQDAAHSAILLGRSLALELRLVRDPPRVVGLAEEEPFCRRRSAARQQRKHERASRSRNRASASASAGGEERRRRAVVVRRVPAPMPVRIGAEKGRGALKVVHGNAAQLVRASQMWRRRLVEARRREVVDRALAVRRRRDYEHGICADFARHVAPGCFD